MTDIIDIDINHCMKTITTTITQRGQVTIPSYVRKILQVSPRDKVSFLIEDNKSVRITPVRFDLEDVFGSVRPTKKPEDFKKLSRDVKEEHVNKIMQELRAQ